MCWNNIFDVRLWPKMFTLQLFWILDPEYYIMLPYSKAVFVDSYDSKRVWYKNRAFYLYAYLTTKETIALYVVRPFASTELNNQKDLDLLPVFFDTNIATPLFEEASIVLILINKSCSHKAGKKGLYDL